MRRLLKGVEALLLPTLALGVVALVSPGRLELAAHIYVLVVAGISLLYVLLRLRTTFPPPRRSPVDEALQPAHRESERVADLARLEREVLLGTASAYDQHFRLRPTLRETAGQLLAARRGIDLDAQPARAQAALGDETWQLVRPDLPPPEDRLGRGLSPERLRRAVDALEAL